MPYKNIEDRRASRRKHYRKNRGYYIDKRQAYRSTVQAKLKEYKESRVCHDCGLSFPAYMLDFDHRHPEEKSYNISRMVHDGFSWESILVEIEKCDLVCANDHRQRTFGQT